MVDSGVGQRRTAQRAVILEVIKAASGPLTIKEVHARAKRRRPSVGRATIYRTIKLLLESRQIRALTLPEGGTRYEDANLDHHCHFRCRSCESIYDLDVCPVSIPDGTTLPDGFRVEGHELTLHGTCPNCA